MARFARVTRATDAPAAHRAERRRTGWHGSVTAMARPDSTRAKRPFWMHQLVEYVLGIVLIAQGLQSPTPAIRRSPVGSSS
jgi:hypothetical protein